MKVNHQYASPSMCLQYENITTLGLSPDLARDEQVFFRGKLKHPLIFRDAMLMLREIVISDASQKKKERPEFFAWLDSEIERRILLHKEYQPRLREELQLSMQVEMAALAKKDEMINKLLDMKAELKKQIDHYDFWKDYYQIERDFWKFIKGKDHDLWFVLDPVITVHPDEVSFEAFSVDESIYGNLSISLDEFEMLKPPHLGTTNIDFSQKLATEIERFRTYNEVVLSIDPKGFTADAGVLKEHMEKKIDLPETWIKGFNQVSSAATLEGIELELSPIDIYDICSFIKRHKAHESPRYMKWILTPNEPIQIFFEPFKLSLTLQAIYHGTKKVEEKIWGRRRWLILEKLIPHTSHFTVKLLGFGMPQFILAHMGPMTMTIGFSSWSSNDWVKGTAFNCMAGFIGDGNYDKVYPLLKEKRMLTFDEICKELCDDPRSVCKAGIGSLLKRGEGYFDASNHTYRFRQLCNTPIPASLYETTSCERQVEASLQEGMDHFSIKLNEKAHFVFSHAYKLPNPKYHKWQYQNTPLYDQETILSQTSLEIDTDGNIINVSCTCHDFKSGPRNISAPCSHILALYLVSTKFFKLDLEPGKTYKINDIMEILL